ncbi:peptide chain release factor N(5)-glutamine methyltransferase [Psychrobacter sp. DM4]|uniref:peptide chain release factor N(5)-glutamine methyltransferase n=1 Tax=Psychrobacter sp. DM4 TaxID=3440637 RepID=UPI003F507C57
MTVLQIKQQSLQLASCASNRDLSTDTVLGADPDTADRTIPAFWITDWLLHVLDEPRSFLFTDEHYELTDTESVKFDTGITQMRQGMPLAYLIGHQEFWSLNFKVNAHTLIPRPDTEVLVEQVLQWIQTKTDNLTADLVVPKRLLDLGTGSGCIAISLAHELSLMQDSKAWQVVAVDICKDALEVAQYNAISNQVPDVKFIQSSWYKALSNNDAHLFDIIVSNPPYIDEQDEHLTSLIAEPISALTAPDSGLADITQIVKGAPKYLKAGGLLAIEHGYDQKDRVQDIFVQHGFESIQTIQDYGDNDRVTLGQTTMPLGD